MRSIYIILTSLLVVVLTVQLVNYLLMKERLKVYKILAKEGVAEKVFPVVRKVVEFSDSEKEVNEFFKKNMPPWPSDFEFEKENLEIYLAMFAEDLKVFEYLANQYIANKKDDVFPRLRYHSLVNVAVNYKKMRILRFLCETAQKNKHKKTYSFLIQAGLGYAVDSMDLDAVKLFVEFGADVNYYVIEGGNMYGDTPLDGVYGIKRCRDYRTFCIDSYEYSFESQEQKNIYNYLRSKGAIHAKELREIRVIFGKPDEQ